MDRESVKSKLDNLVESAKLYRSNQEISDDISMCSLFGSLHEQGGMQVYRGIEAIAQLMGLEIKEGKFDMGEYPYMYSFEYRDILFYQLSEKRFSGYGNAE